MKLRVKQLPAKELSEAPGRDQMEAYSGRKGRSVDVAEKWPAPNLED